MLRHFLLLSLLIPGLAHAQNAGWHLFTSEDCDFSVAMPAEPAVHVDSTSVQGHVITSRTYTVQEGVFTYVVNCSSFPMARMLNSEAQVRMMLRRSAQAHLGRGRSGTIEEVELEGHPGVSYVEQLPGGARIYHLAYLVGERMYQLSAGSLEGESRQKAQRFFTSFAVE